MFLNGTVDTAWTNCGLHAAHVKRTVPRPLVAAHYGESGTPFGWSGFGGSQLFADPAQNLGFGYTVTGGDDSMQPGAFGNVPGPSLRTKPILLALQECLAALAQQPQISSSRFRCSLALAGFFCSRQSCPK